MHEEVGTSTCQVVPPCNCNCNGKRCQHDPASHISFLVNARICIKQYAYSTSYGRF